MSSTDAATETPTQTQTFPKPGQAVEPTGRLGCSDGGELVYLWMTREEICEHLQVPPHTLYRMVQRGEVASNRDGDHLRYRPVAVDRPLAEVEAGAERTANHVDPVHKERYLTALVALVDGLTERVICAERALVRAQQSRTDATAVAKRATRESMVLVRQLNAYCRSLIESNSALQESNANSRHLCQQIGTLRGDLLDLAGSALALPVRARLLSLAERNAN